MRGGVGAFGFGEGTRRFQGGWAGDGDGRLTDIFHLFDFGGKAFLEVGALVLLEIVCQEKETCRGWDSCVNNLPLT